MASRCECRKPKPGMLERAAAALDIELSASWMIGDRCGATLIARMLPAARGLHRSWLSRAAARETGTSPSRPFGEAVAVILQNESSAAASQD